MKSLPPGQLSQELFYRSKNIIARPSSAGLYGISFKKGEGTHITDQDGNVYLDCLTAASANILGYGHRDIARAYYDQAISMQHTGFLYSPNEQAVALGEKLISLTPGSFDKRVILGLSGSDANDGAIEAMRKFTGRMELIHFTNAYHGTTGLSQPASNFGTLDLGIYPTSPWFHEVPFPASPDSADRTLQKVKKLLKRDTVGGFIAEIIQGDAGINIPPKGFFRELVELLHSNESILITDEVQTGMGRTGQWWASLHEEIEPDIVVTAKGLSAGYAPISAAIGREEIVNSMNHGQQVMTYGGHAPSAAAALAVIDYMVTHDLVDACRNKGNDLLQKLLVVRDEYPDVISDVRGRGLMIGVEIINRKDDKAGPVFATRCVEKGLYVGYFGVNQNVVRIEPPFIITDEDVRFIVQTIASVADEIRKHSIPDITYKNVLLYSSGL